MIMVILRKVYILNIFINIDDLKWCAGYIVQDIKEFKYQIMNSTDFRIVHIEPSEAIRITHKVHIPPFSYMIGYYKA